MSNPAPFDLAASAAAYEQALLQRGATAAHAAKQRRVVLRAGSDPAGYLEAGKASWTAATLTDLRTRLSCFRGWLEAQPEGASHAEPWRNLPRGLRAGKGAPGRADFTAAEVVQLLNSPRLPAHRRAAWRAIATLGLRPAEVSRILPEHVVRQGSSFILRLPAECQKSRRADEIHLPEWQAAELVDNCPLIRQSLSHLNETFLLDLGRAGVAQKQGSIVRNCYSLRSFFISELLRNSIDLETVRALARHADVTTTLTFYARHREGHAGTVRSKVFSALRRRA